MMIQVFLSQMQSKFMHQTVRHPLQRLRLQ